MTKDSPVATSMLAFILEYKRQHDGNSPSMREIGKAVGLASHNTVYYYLGFLEKDGLIKREKTHPRSIEVIGGSWRMEEGNAQA